MKFLDELFDQAGFGAVLLLMIYVGFMLAAVEANEKWISVAGASTGGLVLAMVAFNMGRDSEKRESAMKGSTLR